MPENCDMNEQIRAEWITQKLMSIPAGKTIIDVGAGQMRWKEGCAHLQYVSQDFCQYGGEGNGKGLQTGVWNTSQIDIVSDITSIPVEDGTFDAILCSEVLEHVPHPELAIEEFARIIRQEGVLILTAPFASLTHFAPYHFCSGFNSYWYEKILREKGFEIKEVKADGNFFAYLRQECLRLSGVIKKYCGKKSFVMKACSRLLAYLLKRYAERGFGSEELCCFGYMIEAVYVGESLCAESVDTSDRNRSEMKNFGK